MMPFDIRIGLPHYSPRSYTDHSGHVWYRHTPDGRWLSAELEKKHVRENLKIAKYNVREMGS